MLPLLIAPVLIWFLVVFLAMYPKRQSIRSKVLEASQVLSIILAAALIPLSAHHFVLHKLAVKLVEAFFPVLAIFLEFESIAMTIIEHPHLYIAYAHEIGRSGALKMATCQELNLAKIGLKVQDEISQS